MVRRVGELVRETASRVRVGRESGKSFCTVRGDKTRVSSEPNFI